ncbi:MAG: peptide ABC transporter substrate-binding protein [Saprospiraceae bacterium]|nr:peptide ABC transporter substrate-binding protein [Pyrinomonadaceae bacterium]
MLLCLSSLIFLSACTELKQPEAEPFYAETAPPAKQEFRWSNGKAPKTFDPALASAPPETDVARALFEGLTNTDAISLKETAGVAEKWVSSDNFKTWTFYLREDAKWSNGKAVTAQDFVRSWRRLAEMGDQAAHHNLLSNIVGLPLQKIETPDISVDENTDILLNPMTNRTLPVLPQPQGNSNAPLPQNGNNQNSNSNTTAQGPVKAEPFVQEQLGFVAETERILKVLLIRPDKDFPKLVAHPVFSPIYGDAKQFESARLDTTIVTNGAFRIAASGSDGLTLDRSEIYWNHEAIKIERVRFVPKESAEAALEAYRRGELDAVTNAHFAPLALKLLSPYQDFRRTPHSGLNFYEINFTKPPFTDRRVRQALSSAIERERLTESEMEGTTQPALTFLPFGQSNQRILQDKEKARELLEEAGFPDGLNFPVIRLLVNRNDIQHRIARSVARMWKQNLNLETEIIVKEASELELARKTGDFDLIRRGVVFPTADEPANFRAIFGPGNEPVLVTGEAGQAEPRIAEPGKTVESNSNSSVNSVVPILPADESADSFVTAEEAAIFEFYAIPLYFPVSYSLVKPYVSGFDLNSLDAPSLKDVVIDNEWQPHKVKSES